ncbi:MAG: CUB domain-containing protein, partial [Bacteroidia bacterium]
MKLRLFFCLIIVSLYGRAQQSASKVNYTIFNEGFESTLVYEKALSHTQLDGLRYLNSRRKINIEGTKVSIELFSAQELLRAYGKPISPLTTTTPNKATDVMFKLASDNYSLLTSPNSPFEIPSFQAQNKLASKNLTTAFGGFIYDDGGEKGNYANNKTSIQTIYSDNGESPYLKFTSFSTENHFDILYVYDGPDASSKLIGAYSGGNCPTIVEATGAYLTVVFVTDASNNKSGWGALVGRGIAPPPSVSSAPNCASADPFCSGTNYNFPATTGNTVGETGPSYGCLGSEPNPAWYFMQIANTGPLVLSIAGSGGGDVDFICWGPYASSVGMCSALTGTCTGEHCGGNGGALSGNIVDCSYSTSPTETCTIPNAIAGQYYMMMITNFSNQTQNIQLSQTNTATPGAGSTNCNIVNCGVTATNTGPYCVGQTISLSAATTNTTATTYAWTGPNAFSANGQNVTIPNSTLAMSGTYSVTGTTGGTVTCVATTSVTVSANTPPVVNSPTICTGGTATLTATPATNTFVWSTGATTNTISVTPATTTVYTVTGTVGTCTAQNTATVTVIANPTVTVNSGSVCGGTSATLTATGATFYSWSPTTGLNPTAGGTVTATPATTTIYTVTGTVGTCSATPVTATVTIFPSATVTATSNTLCVGGTAAVSASGASTYTWSPSATLSSSSNPNVTATPAVTTSYTVAGTDANGCLGAAISTVTVYSLPVFTVSVPPVCVGQTLNVNATLGYLYSINTTPPASNLSPPISIPNASTSMDGTYIITAVDAHTCSSPSTVAITVNPLPTITASATPVCVGASGILMAMGASTYTWSPTTYLNPSVGSNVSITPTTTTAILYTVIGQDINGCANSTSINVQPTALPIVSLLPSLVKGCAPQCVTYS